MSIIAITLWHNRARARFDPRCEFGVVANEVVSLRQELVRKRKGLQEKNAQASFQTCSMHVQEVSGADLE